MLSVVVPTINEEENLKKLLPEIFRYADEVIVVDDGSTDGTVHVAQANGCRVLCRAKKMGVGNAVYEGVAQAKGNIVAVMDADHSHPFEALRSAVLIQIDAVDIVKFSRFIAGGGMESHGRHFLMRQFNRMMSSVGGVHVHDFTGGYLMGKKSTFDYPKTATQGEWNIEYMIRNRNKRIAEIPYVYRHRKAGDSKWTGFQDVQRLFRYFCYLAYFKIKSYTWD